jgi:hypothetical protein
MRRVRVSTCWSYPVYTPPRLHASTLFGGGASTSLHAEKRNSLLKFLFSGSVEAWRHYFSLKKTD